MNTNSMIPVFVQRWFRLPHDRIGLDNLIGHAPYRAAPLLQRLDWLRNTVDWIRSHESATPKAKAIRLRFLLQILRNNPEIKSRVASTLRSIVQETRALELFMNVGIPNQHGFASECVERLSLILLPQRLRLDDLVSVFTETFRFESDKEWILGLDSKLLNECIELFYFDEGPSEEGWNSFSQDMRDALFLLSHSIRSTGLSRIVRTRTIESDFKKLPFFRLTEQVDALIHSSDLASRNQAYREVTQTLADCFQITEHVYSHIKMQGVKISLIYQIERLNALMRRLGTLTKLFVCYKRDLNIIQRFLALLIRENKRTKCLKALLADNLSLFCHKIVETKAEIREHYIARNEVGHLKVLAKAAGAGIVTGFTTLFKFFIHQLRLSSFFDSFLAVSNYSLSFVSIQLMGFSLAAKQPAATAAAFASKIHSREGGSESLVEELIHILRSQCFAVVGNIICAVPTVLIMDRLFMLIDLHLVDQAYAEHTIKSYSVLGMTPIYAAWTGFLIWAASVFAGWFDSWYNYRNLTQALETHPRLIYAIGRHRAVRITRFLDRNVAGFAANFSLGFLLAMSPRITAIFGVSMEVRHVILSAGALAASAAAVGVKVFTYKSFWLATGGILSMILLNICVSFGLALAVALWAKKASTRQWKAIVRSLFQRIAKKPLLSGVSFNSEVAVSMTKVRSHRNLKAHPVVTERVRKRLRVEPR